jgi:hypothetical protein
MQENDDPDTLQCLDESDEQWVSLWRKATKNKKQANVNFVVSQTSNLPTNKLASKDSRD